MKQRAKISSPGNPFLYPGGRKAAGGVIGGAASQQGTTSGCIAYPGGSSSTFCCFSHRLRRRPPGVNVFTAARKPTPLISSFWDFVFARSTRRSDIMCIRSIIILVDSFHGRSWSQEKILRQGMRSKRTSPRLENFGFPPSFHETDGSRECRSMRDEKILKLGLWRLLFTIHCRIWWFRWCLCGSWRMIQRADCWERSRKSCYEEPPLCTPSFALDFLTISS